MTRHAKGTGDANARAAAANQRDKTRQQHQSKSSSTADRSFGNSGRQQLESDESDYEFLKLSGVAAITLQRIQVLAAMRMMMMMAVTDLLAHRENLLPNS